MEVELVIFRLIHRGLDSSPGGACAKSPSRVGEMGLGSRSYPRTCRRETASARSGGERVETACKSIDRDVLDEDFVSVPAGVSAVKVGGGTVVMV